MTEVKNKPPKAILIKPVPQELWDFLADEKARIKEKNKLRSSVSYAERIVNGIRSRKEG